MFGLKVPILQATTAVAASLSLRQTHSGYTLRPIYYVARLYYYIVRGFAQRWFSHAPSASPSESNAHLATHIGDLL